MITEDVATLGRVHLFEVCKAFPWTVVNRYSGYGVGGANNENVTVNVSLACALELPSTLAVTTVASDTSTSYVRSSSVSAKYFVRNVTQNQYRAKVRTLTLKYCSSQA